MVSPTEAARLALTSLAAHKLRSALTLLGLIISVTSLIVVMTLVQGANTYVQERSPTWALTSLKWLRRLWS